MSSKCFEPEFHSPVARLMEQFIQEKQACGYKYHIGTRLLQQRQSLLSDKGLNTNELPWSVTRQWIAKRPHERQHPTTPDFHCAPVCPVHVPYGLSALSWTDHWR